MHGLCVIIHTLCIIISRFLKNKNLSSIWVFRNWKINTSVLISNENFELTLSWPAGHICPTYEESFQVRWDNSIPLFLHVAIYLEVSLLRWTSQNAFSRETAVYKWYCVQCCIVALHTVPFWLVQRSRDTSRYLAAWRKDGLLLSQRTWKYSL